MNTLEKIELTTSDRAFYKLLKYGRENKSLVFKITLEWQNKTNKESFLEMYKNDPKSYEIAKAITELEE